MTFKAFLRKLVGWVDVGLEAVCRRCTHSVRPGKHFGMHRHLRRYIQSYGTDAPFPSFHARSISMAVHPEALRGACVAPYLPWRPPPPKTSHLLIA